MLTLPDHHRDLFDRIIIIAQAICENMTLVSGDSHAFSYRVGHSYLAHLRRVMSLALEYGAIGVASYAVSSELPEAYRDDLPSPEQFAARLKL